MSLQENAKSIDQLVENVHAAYQQWDSIHNADTPENEITKAENTLVVACMDALYAHFGAELSETIATYEDDDGKAQFTLIPTPENEAIDVYELLFSPRLTLGVSDRLVIRGSFDDKVGFRLFGISNDFIGDSHEDFESDLSIYEKLYHLTLQNVSPPTEPPAEIQV